MVKRFPVVCWMIVVASVAVARAGTEPVTATDLLHLRTVESIDVNASGLEAVVAIRSIETVPAAEDAAADAEPSCEYRVHLYLLDLFEADAEPRQLTFGPRLDLAPAISPDGSRVAFLRIAASTAEDEDEDDAAAQVWVMRLDGGEAWQVTRLAGGARAPQWSPDGRRLLVRSPVPARELGEAPPWPAERPGATSSSAGAPEGVTPRPDGTRAEIRAWLDRNGQARDPAVITRLEFQDEHALRGAARFDQVFLVDPDHPDAEPQRVTGDSYDHADAAFMPDGRSIVYAARKPVDRHPDRALEYDLWRVNLDGSDDRKVLDLEGWSLRRPRPSQDGALLAFVGRKMDAPADRPNQLGLVSVAADGSTGAPLWLTDEETFDAPVFAFDWLPARASLVFTSARHGAFPLVTAGTALLEPAVLLEERDGARVGVHAFGTGGGTIVYAETTAANPCVLRLRDARGDRLLWDLNDWVARKRLAAPVEGWIDRPDGLRVQYWLMEPTNRRARQTYPLALEIHGGPGAMWGPGEQTMWLEFQLLCSWGYGVVYANPRGSGGYGYDFEHANYQDWGAGPAGDVLATVDQVIADNPWIDPDRLVVTGGSYGGYLTAWIVTQDTRFKAAVAQRGVYDLDTFFGEGNAWRLVRWEMGGFPFDARYRPIIDRNSPITYVQRIHTPLLIMHADQDLRTGVSQSEMLYRALKELGRPVEYIRYPGAGHDLSRTGKPRQRLDRLNRIVEFFERHIENDRPAPGTDGR